MISAAFIKLEKLFPCMECPPPLRWCPSPLNSSSDGMLEASAAPAHCRRHPPGLCSNLHKNMATRNRQKHTQSAKMHRKHSRGLLYIGMILIYGLFLPCDVMAWSNRYPRHIVPQPTSPRPTLPPVFDTRNPTNVTVTASKTAVLSCIVHNLSNNSVSWIRHRDLHILTVGPATYTSDDRFLVVPDETTGDWALRLMYARPRDSGQYDCQVSSTPATGRTFHLEIVEPQAEVLRAPEMHVGVGSLINLTCVVPYSPETPEYLHWYHKERMVREDGNRVWMRTQLGHKSISQLVVKDAQPSDSGRYTCSPAHSKEHSITVHVLTAGEYPAAMQGGSSLTCAPHWRLLRLMVAPITTLLIASHKPYFYM